LVSCPGRNGIVIDRPHRRCWLRRAHCAAHRWCRHLIAGGGNDRDPGSDLRNSTTSTTRISCLASCIVTGDGELNCTTNVRRPHERHRHLVLDNRPINDHHHGLLGGPPRRADLDIADSIPIPVFPAPRAIPWSGGGASKLLVDTSTFATGATAGHPFAARPRSDHRKYCQHLPWKASVCCPRLWDNIDNTNFPAIGPSERHWGGRSISGKRAHRIAEALRTGPDAH